jgi:enoyl-CoA hydratase/carnithine racemase
MRVVDPSVRIESRGEIAVILADNPPVNALSHAVRAGLLEAIGIATADASVSGIVFACAGRTFFAGADITEFGKPTLSPNLSDLIRALDDCPKPTAAALFGTALGGGFELALACHFRVASADARVGLPEVKLGILPGAGGTQRLPRLVGPERALRMIVSGDPIRASLAHEWGAIDVIAEDPVDGAARLLREVLEERRPVTRVRDREQQLAASRADSSLFDATVVVETRRSGGAEAPVVCAQSVRNSFLLPFDAALEMERASFQKLVVGEQSAALRYLFFAERRAAKSPDFTGLTARVGPQMLARALTESERLLGEGLSWRDVDAIWLQFGFSAGPLALADTVGIDVVRKLQKNLGTTGACTRKQNSSAADGVQRLLYPMVNEAARILRDETVQRAADIDVVCVRGYGWPAWRGGPCFFADSVGIASICRVLDDRAAATGDCTLAPASLLQACAASNSKLTAISRDFMQSATAATPQFATGA